MFFYSLPILFNDIKSVNFFEFLFMTVAILVLLYISAPQEKNWQPKPYSNFLLTAWLGGVSLYWVFWPFFLCLNAGLVVADLLAKSASITVSTWDEIHFALFLGVVWWSISIWRCSSNTRLRVWAALARLATVAVFVEYGLMMFIRIYYPRIFFNCEEALLDYGSCF
ncbi:conserved membrane hypothetical protein [Crenothrix polyspora]|jgi:hypothetical protein|uniref:Uncharacterized protein n=2 Tax=Crenothrix polyspora TaxID=360316 RepID=A0A1R4H0P0_9GAMM|nr:conserved membrane hypothetical protein [Crenothrix polyspora]